MIRVLFIALTFVLISCGGANEGIVYVSLQEVFDQFELKKELAAKLDNELSSRKSKVDSLEYSLQVRKRSFEGAESEFYKEYRADLDYFTYLKTTYEEDAAKLTAQYDEQIWKRITSYVKSYGEEKGLKLVLGQKNEGTLLYVQKGIDRTQEVINYVNLKYRGE